MTIIYRILNVRLSKHKVNKQEKTKLFYEKRRRPSSLHHCFDSGNNSCRITCILVLCSWWEITRTNHRRHMQFGYKQILYNMVSMCVCCHLQSCWKYCSGRLAILLAIMCVIGQRRANLLRLQIVTRIFGKWSPMLNRRSVCWRPL